MKNLKDIQETFKSGYKLRAGSVTLFAKPNGLFFPRLAIKAPKRNIPKAVDRNAIKRMLRESFRSQQPLLAGLDIVVVVYQKPHHTEEKFFCDSLARQWHRLVNHFQKNI